VQQANISWFFFVMKSFLKVLSFVCAASCVLSMPVEDQNPGQSKSASDSVPPKRNNNPIDISPCFCEDGATCQLGQSVTIVGLSQLTCSKDQCNRNTDCAGVCIEGKCQVAKCEQDSDCGNLSDDPVLSHLYEYFCSNKVCIQKFTEAGFSDPVLKPPFNFSENHDLSMYNMTQIGHALVYFNTETMPTVFIRDNAHELGDKKGTVAIEKYDYGTEEYQNRAFNYTTTLIGLQGEEIDVYKSNSEYDFGPNYMAFKHVDGEIFSAHLMNEKELGEQISFLNGTYFEPKPESDVEGQGEHLGA
jgi:hypothetical protein